MEPLFAQMATWQQRKDQPSLGNINDVFNHWMPFWRSLQRDFFQDLTSDWWSCGLQRMVPGQSSPTCPRSTLCQKCSIQQKTSPGFETRFFHAKVWPQFFIFCCAQQWKRLWRNSVPEQRSFSSNSIAVRECYGSAGMMRHGFWSRIVAESILIGKIAHMSHIAYQL